MNSCAMRLPRASYGIFRVDCLNVQCGCNIVSPLSQSGRLVGDKVYQPALLASYRRTDCKCVGIPGALAVQ